MRNFQKKNYYMLQSLINDFDHYSVISFDIFDVMLLYSVYSSNDIFLQLEQYAEDKHNISNFGAVRRELEAFEASSPITIIYQEVKKRYGQVAGDLQQKEYELIVQYTITNPTIHTLYEEAIKKQKKVVAICGDAYPKDFLEHLLREKGYDNVNVFSTGSTGKKKKELALYQYSIEQMGINPAQLLHIGCDRYVYDELRKHSIGAYFYLPLRERLEENVHDSALEGVAFPLKKPDSLTLYSLEESQKMASTINSYYSQVVAPEDEIAIDVNHVSMMFNMSPEKIDNLKEYMVKLFTRKLTMTPFWALKDISFQVRKGEKVGLIGFNGSGKSTTLKIVSGVMRPTKGYVAVHGTIAPLIELGAGFDDKLSARENVYLNGAILGHSHQEMDQVYDQIIDFAELKEFQDVAIKNFSSGMVARLGFAIATAFVPDILIIDEILSVGDYEFQKKCHRKMNELTGQGATVLFVSHSSTDIINMCDRAVWLDHGTLIDDGEAEYVVGKYIRN